MMASLIFLERSFGQQRKATRFVWDLELGQMRKPPFLGSKAVIAKGNIIEGIEAKE